MTDRPTAPTLAATVARLQEREIRPTVAAVLESLELGPVRGIGVAVADEPGELLGRLRPGAEIGRGGMGRVLEAEDPDLLRTVAVKVLMDPELAGAEEVGRFVAEARITSQLEHPNIVPVYELGIGEAGQVWFSMHRVRGRSLDALIGELAAGDEEALARWSRHRLLTAFVQVCNAVAYAHDRGVLHRDLKPANVMLGRFGEVLLMDWGVARVTGEVDRHGPVSLGPPGSDSWSELESMIGTPGYMAPEQAKAEGGDRRSDVWSLGAILYELLTWQRAYQGSGALQLLYKATLGPPPDPREVAPERQIPEEIAAVCMRSLQSDPADRQQDAVQLGAEVRAFLEGSLRRARAAHLVEEGEAAWRSWLALSDRVRDTRSRLEELGEEVPAWASLEDKAELHRTLEELEELELLRAEGFEGVVATSETALAEYPGHADARALLARAYLARMEEAEERGDRADQRYWERRVSRYDDGRLATVLRGTGRLTLRTSPSGAEVLCQRFDRRGLVWKLGEATSLGRTPLVDVPLEMGSWLLTLRLEGFRPLPYPVAIERSGRWDGGERPVRLYRDGEIGDGFVVVPGGPFVCGGDPEAMITYPRSRPVLPDFAIAVHHVTMIEYCEFLNALHTGGRADEAWSRTPRYERGLSVGGGQWWDRPGPDERYTVPERDRDGDEWSPQWPAFGLSWHDAVAYVAWRAERDGVAWRLPTELEWEKAARGVDGRHFPWGDRFDATLCLVRDSRPGRGSPQPIGFVPTDVSVYGVRDLAGGMRDWCGDADFDGKESLRPVRGGSWDIYGRNARCANRSGYEPWTVVTHDSFRLVRDLPGAGID